MVGGRLVEIKEGRILNNLDRGGELFPQLELLRTIWLSPSHVDGTVPEKALEIAKEEGCGLGRTFIMEIGRDPYQSNGPWNFSAETYKRHDLPVPDKANK